MGLTIAVHHLQILVERECTNIQAFKLSMNSNTYLISNIDPSVNCFKHCLFTTVPKTLPTLAPHEGDMLPTRLPPKLASAAFVAPNVVAWSPGRICPALADLRRPPVA